MSERRAPTEEQRAAIEAIGAAVVRAGAGCGKTRVLAERFVHLLGPGPDGAPPPVADVGQILAITFTEKAAAEMKTRIRAEVARLIEASAGDARRHWQRIRRELLGAQVSTIHAFCARLLRENPLEARIDPRAVVLDEHESRGFLETAVERELLARLRARDPAAGSLLLGQGLRSGRDGGAAGLVVRFLGTLASGGHDGAWLREATARQAERRGEMAAALRRAVERLVGRADAEIAALKPRKGKGLPAVVEEWPAWRARLLTLAPETPIADVLALRDLCQRFADARIASRLEDDLELQPGGKLTGAVAQAYGALAAVPRTTALADLVATVADAVAERKRDEGVLTFDDLIAETRTLFRDHPVVRDRYARRFRAVLVDEFQDTDAVQAELIERLVSGPDAPALFAVGDEKQAIYRFRGADVRVFQRVRAAIGREYPLGTNFRSEPAIVDFVNALAAHVLRVPPGSRDATHWTVFDAGQRLVADRPQAAPRPAVRLVSLVPEHRARRLNAEEGRELEARVVAGVVHDLHHARGVRWGDVAVLFRALTAVKAYEHALRERDVPYYVVKGRGFFQCQEVTDVTSLLAAVADPDDGLALAAFLRSPFVALDDDTLRRLARPPGAERARLTARFRARESFADLPEHAATLLRARDILVRLRALRSRATVAELLREALASTDFEAVCLTQFQGTQKVANVRRLIDLARDCESRRYFTLRDFVRHLRELVEREPREAEAQLVGEQDDVVRLMTIHQAKGLEFPVVVIPDLGRRLDPETRTMVVDESLGLLAEAVDAVGRRTIASAWLADFRAREEDRNRAELARLFYVACTRARDQIVLIEGKGSEKYLASGDGDGHVWCHRIWELLGRDRVAAFLAGETPDAVLPAAEAEVRIERADAYRARGATRAAEPPEPVDAEPTDAERDAVARVLDFAVATPQEVVAAPTALAEWRRCPRQYWYRHVVGVPERGTGGERATLMGTLAHAVLERLDLERATVDAIAARVAERPEALRLRDAERTALVADLVAAAASLRADVASGLVVVARELPFVLPLRAGDTEVFLHGRIDLLARRSGALVVRDYKYAAPGPEGAARYAAQLAPYRLAVAAGGVPAAAEIVFLRGGTVVEPLPPIDADAERAALARAAVALAGADARGGAEAFPRGPETVAECEALGCGYVRRCRLTRRAPDSRYDRAAS